ncbi:MAG: hypothetical protein DRP56_00750 [Planctomycetota bacterium]|nr:MAG: hypothetical protein DRP56_00750 [Planctomycetota bacterium]
MGRGNDWIFINFIKKELNSGKTRIEIPGELLQGVSKEILNEARALVKLAGAKISTINIH